MKNQKVFKFQVLFTSLLVAAFVLAALGISGKAVYAQDIPLTEVPAQPLVTAVPTQAPQSPVVTDSGNSYVTFESVMQGNGKTLTATGIHGPSSNPLGASAEAANVVNPDPASAVALSVPTMKWVFGCSAVSSAMIAGFYDRNGYPNIYTGPTGGGFYPLTEPSSWGTWSDGTDTYPNNPLIASHQGLDGRTTKGSIDDYWVKYGSSAQDPYVTGSWTQHTWGASIGDYMKTSQSAYYSTDGNTWFWNYDDNTKLQCSEMPSDASGFGSNTIAQEDGTYGRKLFYEAKGYTVTDCYNQEVDGQATGGFSLANYKAQIDAGHPVLLNLAGHSIVGVGYLPGSSTIYVHDTWDNNTHTMVWNGSYSNMQLLSVSIVNLKAGTTLTVPVPSTPSMTTPDYTPPFTWSRVTNATQYSFMVLKGATTIYSKTVAASSCGSSATTCTNTPTNVLSDGAYTWKVQAYIGGVWKSYSSPLSFTVTTIPTPSAPTGIITTKTPTFTFSRINHSTQYFFTVYKSGSPVYSKTVATGSCGSNATNCSYTPTTALTAGAYTWKVRAYVGGVWKNYSASTSFTYTLPGAAFDSEFTTDAAGWTPVHGTWNVSGGYYQAVDTNSFASSKRSNIYGTLTYEVSLKRTGAATNTQGIYFDGTPTPLDSAGDWYSGYLFVYANNGEYAVFEINEGSIYNLTGGWVSYSGLTSGINTLKVTRNKTTGYTQFYINGTRVNFGTLVDLSMGAVGLAFYSNGTAGNKLYVDYAKLSLAAPSSSSDSTIISGGLIISDQNKTRISSFDSIEKAQ